MICVVCFKGGAGKPPAPPLPPSPSDAAKAYAPKRRPRGLASTILTDLGGGGNDMKSLLGS